MLDIEVVGVVEDGDGLVGGSAVGAAIVCSVLHVAFGRDGNGVERDRLLRVRRSGSGRVNSRSHDGSSVGVLFFRFGSGFTRRDRSAWVQEPRLDSADA